MREISRFQMNVAVVTENLRARAEMEDAAQETEKLWKKFSETKQEPVRMATALFGYFLTEEIPEEQRKAYSAYLKTHIRNTVETLIEEDDPDKIDRLEKQGWFGSTELAGFIQTAMEREKSQSLIYLMRLKNQKYGYQEETFEL